VVSVRILSSLNLLIFIDFNWSTSVQPNRNYHQKKYELDPIRTDLSRTRNVARQSLSTTHAIEQLILKQASDFDWRFWRVS
jgi:hypothetical protein